MKTVPLNGKRATGRVVLVSDEDYDLVTPFRWFVTERERDGRVHGPYAQAHAWLDGKPCTLKIHRLITGWPMVDHIDHDGLNNQRQNLRPTTPRDNQQNTRPRLKSTSKYKGVSWNKGRGKWLVQLHVPGQSHYVGQSLDEGDAARMYDRAAWAAYGDLACLNFPGEYSAGLSSAVPPMVPNRDAWVPSIKPFRSPCKKCGGPIKVNNKLGICTRNPECAAEAKKIHNSGQGKPKAA